MSRVQPARLVLVQRGLTIRDAAVGTDYSPHWVSRVLRGLDRPSRRFRRALAEWLDLPEQVLFHDDSPGGMQHDPRGAARLGP